MGVLEWILVLFSLSMILLGLVFLFRGIPARWKGPAEPNRDGTFFIKFAGVALIVYGLESFLHALASLMGEAWPDTNGVIGVSIVTLAALTIGMAYLSGMVLTSNDVAQSRRWQLLMGTTFVMLATGFFMAAMGHKMSIEWMESIGQYLKLAVLPLWLAAFSKRKSGESARSSENE